MFRLLIPLWAACGGVLHAQSAPPEGAVRFDTDFPGGNLRVIEAAGPRPEIAPDLRGGRDWFYWYFEATAVEPGRVTFVFPKKVAGFENGAIGNQGPAVSRDAGRSWNWMGTAQVEENTFYHDFSRAGESLRFAVTIPYLEKDLARFLQPYRDRNPHLRADSLTTSAGGRDVEILEVLPSNPSARPVLVTARHHAVETMASYLLEGILAEALSDSEAAVRFREKYHLWVIPFVDKDGVEEGDQGKGRQPHDHNRDYGLKSIYPEVKAIKALGEKRKFHFALDLHCPTLVMPDHQVIYFVGAQRSPPHNLENVRTFAGNIRRGLPEEAPHGPLVWLRDEKSFSPLCSRYFGLQEQCVMSATLEFPFAPPGRRTDVESCRRYGAAVLEALADSEFIE